MNIPKITEKVFCCYCEYYSYQIPSFLIYHEDCCTVNPDINIKLDPVRGRVIEEKLVLCKFRNRDKNCGYYKEASKKKKKENLIMLSKTGRTPGGRSPQ